MLAFLLELFRRILWINKHCKDVLVIAGTARPEWSIEMGVEEREEWDKSIFA